MLPPCAAVEAALCDGAACVPCWLVCRRAIWQLPRTRLSRCVVVPVFSGSVLILASLPLPHHINRTHPDAALWHHNSTVDSYDLTSSLSSFNCSCFRILYQVGSKSYSSSEHRSQHMMRSECSLSCTSQDHTRHAFTILSIITHIAEATYDIIQSLMYTITVLNYFKQVTTSSRTRPVTRGWAGILQYCF